MAKQKRKRSDPYEALGVARDVAAEGLRKAYRKLARQYHPDVNPGDAKAEERFKQVSEAYAVLSSEEKRRNYDEFGELSLEGGFDADAARRSREAFGARFGGGAAPFGFEADGERFEFGDLDELLGRAFRGGGRRGGRTRGPDLHAALELEFLEAALGCEKKVTLTSADASGAARNETLSVRVPPGVADGGRLRLAGKGGAGVGGGPAGDLYAEIRVRPHSVFRRDGRDVHLDLPLSVAEAVRGAKVEVPTLVGRATLSVPAGTDSGRKLRLKGKGIPAGGGAAAGDLYVSVQIRVPRGASESALAALDALGGPSGDQLREELFR